MEILKDYTHTYTLITINIQMLVLLSEKEGGGVGRLGEALFWDFFGVTL